MCVIIFKPADVTISKKIVEAAFTHNPHGAGLTIRQSGKLSSLKGFFEFEPFWKIINTFQDSELTIHCRIATSGLINKGFCHPFKVEPGSYLFHNGVIHNMGTKDYSDTYILSKLLEKHFNQKEGILGHLANNSSNKFALIGETNQFFGGWKNYEGLKLSNDYFLPLTPVVTLTKNSPFVVCPTCKTIRPKSKWMCVCGDARLF